jgi:putative ABC transport system substrate-binding protein
MRRREFISLFGGAAAMPFAAHAQQLATPVIGFLSGRSLATDAHLVAAFRQGLSEAGYLEGRDVVIEYHWADGQVDRLLAMATDLVKRQVSVIFAGGMDVKLQAVKAAIPTIPIVFATGIDPVELGLVASMSLPGGNITAVTVLTTALQSKRLELLRNLLPSVTLVALLLNPNHPAADTITRDVRTAAKVLGVQIYVAAARDEHEIDDAISAVKREQADALLVTADPLFIGRRQQVIGPREALWNSHNL